MTAVFLDLDGTLTDPKPGITGAVIHAMGELGMDAPSADDLEWVIGPPLLDSFATLGVPDPAAALDLYRAHYAKGGLLDARVYDGILPALKALAGAGHVLFLATAKPHVFATQITAHFRLDTHLSAQYGPEMDGTRQDKAELLAHALQQQGLSATDSVMIGDRDNDLRAARATGMRFIGVSWGYSGFGELDTADAICATPDALVDTVSVTLRG